MKQMYAITVVTTYGRFDFKGYHDKQAESENWHYYKTDCGDWYHFRKEHMVMVLEEKA